MPAISTEEEVRGRLERLASLGARSAELAHELRNALAVLETSLHLVRKTLKGSEELPRVEKQLSRMAEQIHAGQALVREALDEVRAQAPERAPLDLRSLVLEVVAGIARPDHVALEVEVAGHTVSVDARLMRQLLLNLVRNAVEALAARPEAGRVRVVGKRVGNDLLLVVEDNGPGIDESVAPRLFQAFNTSKSNGTGLGLAVCRRIAEAHGGQIVARRAEPRGTTMEVRIPV
jgi:signal transduction histidine kinase